MRSRHLRRASYGLFAATALSWLACIGDDPVEPTPPEDEGFRLVLADAPGGSPLAAWRLPESRTAYVVGGSILGSGPGFVWRVEVNDSLPSADTVATSPAALWWVHGVAADRAWVVGDGGYAARFDGARLEPLDTGTTATLYGVWTPDGDVVWAVGGSLGGEGEQGVLLRSQGGRPFERVDYGAPFDGSFYKVWGSAADDVFVVGERGTILHHDGSSWTRMQSGTTARLGVVHGRSATQVWAAGGDAEGLLLRWDGSSWRRDTSLLPGLAPLYGLWVSPEPGESVDPASPSGEPAPAALYVSGIYGTVARRYDDGPFLVQANADSGDVLHSVVGWGTSPALALGGNLLDGPPFRAVVLALSWGFEEGLPLDGELYWRSGQSPARTTGGGGFQ